MALMNDFVCLANSRKFSGRCIAGKFKNSNGNWVWVRPVGGSGGKEITENDRKYSDGSSAQALDVIAIELKGRDAHPYQSENVVIDSNYYWRKVGDWPIAQLNELVDRPASLWTTGCSSTSGLNDRVPEASLKSPLPTLVLIEPINVRISVGVEGAMFGGNKRKVRAWFTYAGVNYGLAVTDPALESNYLARQDGTYNDDGIKYMTISLGEPYDGNAYKLVAAAF